MDVSNLDVLTLDLRRANQAETDSLFKDPIESEESNESTDLEAKVHESSFHARTQFSKQTDPDEVHLQDKTKQVIKSDPGNIAALLAQTKKVKLSDTKKTSHMLPADRAKLSYEACLHEQFTPRHDYVPEAYNTVAPYSTDLQVSMANLSKDGKDTGFSGWIAQWADENGGLVAAELSRKFLYFIFPCRNSFPFRPNLEERNKGIPEGIWKNQYSCRNSSRNTSFSSYFKGKEYAGIPVHYPGKEFLAGIPSYFGYNLQEYYFS